MAKLKNKFVIHFIYSSLYFKLLQYSFSPIFLKEVLRFWLSHGVDGFRMDAVPYLFEDSLFRNEPYVDENIKNSKMYDSLIHIYSMDRPKTYEMIGQFRKVLDDFAKEHNTPPK